MLQTKENIPYKIFETTCYLHIVAEKIRFFEIYPSPFEFTLSRPSGIPEKRCEKYACHSLKEGKHIHIKNKQIPS